VARDHVSQTDLPQPVVLVVGDDSSYFSSEVWAGVVDAAEAEHRKATEITSERLEPILEADYSEAYAHLQKDGLGWMKRPPTRKPIPLQLSHDHDPDPGKLRTHLLRILDLFDVWAIVASASAGDVKRLREAIEGIDIPLLVTTDSTTVPASGQRSNELRLMPSNKAQATAMLFTAIRGREPSTRIEAEERPLRARPPIACSAEATPQARQYVSDLEDQLHKEARRHDIKIADFRHQPDHSGPVIVVGYSDHALSLIKSRPPRRLTILSDGCVGDKRVRQAVEGRREDPEFWYVARPEVQLREVGRTCFSAVQEAGGKLLTWEARTASDSDLPRTSLRDVIKGILSESSKQFNFEGIENVAPAYRVEPVLDDVDPGTAAPPGQEPVRPKPSRGGLRAV
jgi:hypothetical protein